MGNCLVTKLQEVVQNDNLLPLGGFILKTGVGNCNFEVALPPQPQEVELEIKGNGAFTDSNYENPTGKTKTLSTYGMHSVYLKTTEECIIVIPDNYQITQLIFDNVYSEDLSFTKFRSITNVLIKNSSVIKINKGELYVAQNSNRVEVRNASEFRFNINQLSGNTRIYSLLLPDNPNVYGDINSLYGCIGLTNIVSNIVTDIETLALGWKNNSTSKTSTCTVSGKNMKLNGNNRSGSVKVVFTGTHSIDITDTNDNILAYYDGSTWTYNV